MRIVDKMNDTESRVGNRTRDSKHMNATETGTGTARNTNPVGALRCTPNASLVFTGRARDGQEEL